MVTETLAGGVPFVAGAIAIARLERMYDKVADKIAEVAIALYAAWVLGHRVLEVKARPSESVTAMVA